MPKTETKRAETPGELLKKYFEAKSREEEVKLLEQVRSASEKVLGTKATIAFDESVSHNPATQEPQKSNRDFALTEALQYLKQPRTCTELGEYLWTQLRKPLRRTSPRQSYARPAGRIIQRLIKMGRVQRVYPQGWAKRPPQYQAISQKRKYSRGKSSAT